MKKFISGYLHFNSQERKGLIAILVLIGFVWLLPTMLKLHSKEKSFPFMSTEPIIDSAGDSANNISNVAGVVYSDNNHESLNSKDVKSQPAAVLYAFDPNTLSLADWKKFGISEHVVHAILNYRSKGGIFHAPSDLKKIYGLNANDFNRLLPYISIADSFKLSEEPAKVQNKNTASILEINSADSNALVALPGIGPVLAVRILRYRNNLGGFYSVEQLKEVYGITDETLALITNRIKADSSKIQKIDINHISLSDLQKHFYFRNPVAKTIISYRDEHGAFQSVNDLNRIEILTSEQINKMQPYLSFTKQ